MNPITFSELFQQVSQLYQSQEFQRALQLLDNGLVKFSERAWKIHFWRMCMAGKMNDVPLAVRIFEEAIQSGYWYSETQLREDNDLEILQGVLEFEQLVNICRERQQKAEEQTIFERKIIEPIVSAGERKPLLMALHGNDRNMSICESFWATSLSSDWLMVFPQSSQISGPEAFVWNDWKLGVREVRKHYAEIHDQYSVNQEQRIIGGFSMGGRLAIRMSLCQDVSVNGFVAVSPFMPSNDSWEWVAMAQNEMAKNLRGFFIFGEKDKSSYDGVKNLITILQNQGISCEMESLADMGHSYPDNFATILKRGVNFVLNAS